MLIGLGATFLTSRVRALVSNVSMPHTFSPFFLQFFSQIFQSAIGRFTACNILAATLYFSEIKCDLDENVGE